MHDGAWGPTHKNRLRAKVEPAEEWFNPDWEVWEARQYLRNERNLKPGTTRKYLAHWEFMANYEPQPVEFRSTAWELVTSYRLYFQYRRDHDDTTGRGGLVNDDKAIKAFAAFMGLPENIWPSVPKGGGSGSMNDVPSPEQVHELLCEIQYAPQPNRNPEHHFVKYALAFAYGIGLRCPDELYTLRVDDFDPESQTLEFIQRKKSGRPNLVYVEPDWLATSRRHASLTNWIDTWRPKLDPKTDAMFPNPETGEEFASKKTLGQAIKRRVKPHAEWFDLRHCRHWCATARLIQTHDEKAGYNFDQIANWLGHKSTERVRNTYAKNVEVWHHSHGDDWLIRAWQNAPTTSGGS
ncbi:hypothetical protein BRD56_04550 [Thermoplasmatales archaeon SW_10_69_26]|nr:MAG: hypothetical protein BRD56_04550 [Thermoplasmatales archaeon SW_10_69_26]